MAVLVASSELEELQLICHRIAVMRHGAIAAILPHRDATKERIMTAAAGTGAATGTAEDTAEDTTPLAYGASPMNGTGQ